MNALPSRSHYVRQRNAPLWRPIQARRRRTAEVRKKREEAFGDSLFQRTWLPPEDQMTPYDLETQAWPDSRHLRWAVTVSSLVASTVIAWLLWRIFVAT
ncbi:hypothetical protein GT347_25200 [Xylophilus rhododendri]|uniref:Uncharacterized protein n=1 Tax=Xylophilus rhododendri TaxID=2697032 RepID=A0A857JAP9_9BURK|nr:hypothetical protein [Xylophilus rhododendri]QHJ00997.1 hypothetical protein GT347_25200 [Xylophilus rhododendri]